MVSRAELPKLMNLKLLCFIICLPFSSCKSLSPKSGLPASGVEDSLRCSYTAVIIPAGGRVYDFKLEGYMLSPDSAFYESIRIDLDCNSDNCSFSIAGSAQEPVEGAEALPYYKAGENIILYFGKNKRVIEPTEKSSSSNDRY
jgi:hypothetical protein